MDSKSGFKLVRSVKADTFDLEHLDQYTLLLQLGLRDFQAAAFDGSQGTLLWLEDYALQEHSGYGELAVTLGQIREGSPLLAAGFWKRLVVCHKGPHYMQIPAEFQSAGLDSNCLQLNSRCNLESEKLLVCTTGHPEVLSVFGFPIILHDWIIASYPRVPKQIIHQSAALISNALAWSSPGDTQAVHLVTDRFRMHLTAIGDNRVLYYNQFAIRDFNDYTRYLSVAFHILDLDPEVCPVILWGFMTQQSPHALEMKDLVKTLDFGRLRKDFIIGPAMAGIQEHQYPDLFSALSVNSVGQ